MPKAEYRSAIRSRKMINAALADLLLEKPLDKITVTDVVTRAQINRGTFYAHYADIPDVIDNLIQQTFAGIREAISLPPESLNQIPAALLGRIQNLLENDLEFYKKIMNSSAAPLMMNRLMDVVLEYLLENEVLFFPDQPEQYALTIRFCAGGLSGLYRDWFTGKLNMSLDELTAAATAFLQQIIAGI